MAELDNNIVLSALMGFMPFVAYDQNLDNNYTTPYIMAYYGTTSAVKINVPFTWSGTRRCVQIRITGASISYRAYNGSSWSSYVSAAFS